VARGVSNATATRKEDEARRPLSCPSFGRPYVTSTEVAA
jgi:hypothetical protein